MKNDELDKQLDSFFDELDFKPITEGLGFHHSIKEKKDLGLSLNSKKKELESDLLLRAERLREGQEPKLKSTSMGELAPFYESETTKEIELSLNETEQANYSNDVEASLALRLGAWSLDLMILLTVTVVTISAIIIFANLPLDVLSNLMISDDITISAIALFSMFYVFYFSFFDKTLYSTPGKRILGIKVIALKGNVKLTQSFMRSLLTFASVATLGLVGILKMQDRLTDTSVVKK